MIELKIEDYCQNCPEFTPELNTQSYSKESFFEPVIETEYYHIVGCVHAERCKEITRHIQKEMSKKGKTDERTSLYS